MQTIDINDISVIVILYNPSDKDIENVSQISLKYKGVICDNTPSAVARTYMLNKMLYIANGSNIGIAAAQNKAIRSISDYKYIVFLDQDSRLGESYPEQIVSEYMSAREKFPNIAIIGPTLINGRNDGEYKSDIHKDYYISDNLIKRENIIASGACIPKDVIDSVGLNEERLFIDLVDSEWCWRANSKGYFCAITSNISITHTIGRKLIKVWKFNDIISSPFRYFYQIRNYVWMLPRTYVPCKWKINNGIKYIIRIFYLPFCKDGFKSWLYMWKGLFAGILGLIK